MSSRVGFKFDPVACLQRLCSLCSCLVIFAYECVISDVYFASVLERIVSFQELTFREMSEDAIVTRKSRTKQVVGRGDESSGDGGGLLVVAMVVC